MSYRIILLLLFCLATGLLWAQDMDRMNRDIEVTENILASLLQEEYETKRSTGVLWGNTGSIEGSYIEDFGLLFTMAPRFRMRAVTVNEGKVYIRSGEEGVIVVPEEEPEEPEEEDEESENEKEKRRFGRFVETFATDYAYLLRELPADEKIMIRYGAKGNRLFQSGGVWAISGSRRGGAYSAVIKKSDLDAYQEGRISEEQLRNRIEFVFEEAEEISEDRDLEILTNIFSTLYKDASDRTIGLRGSPRYEKIPGLGAFVYLSAGPAAGGTYVLSGSAIGFYNQKGKAPLPPAKEENEKMPELAAELSSAYPEFMEELKQNIVEYGSIVRSLQEDEALIFQVDFFDCRDCNVLPEKVEITAKQPTLAAYRKGTVNLQTAVGQLKVERTE